MPWRGHGVDACFANPGTSEMQLVAALDKQPRIRAVLCLFEGVVTGAADGYGRMADKPALTLLHLGPGFANGMANHTTRSALGRPYSTWWAITPQIIFSTMRHSRVTSKAWPHRYRAPFAYLTAQRGWRKPASTPSRTVLNKTAASAPCGARRSRLGGHRRAIIGNARYAASDGTGYDDQ